MTRMPINSRQVRTLHATDVTRLLQGLVAKGAMVQEGQVRWSRYRLPDGARSIHKPEDSEHKRGRSVHKGGRSEHGDDVLAVPDPHG